MADILADLGVQRAIRKKNTKHGDARLQKLDPITDRDEYMKVLNDEVNRMYNAAKAVQASDTGNTKAYNTYMQVAAAYIDRLKRMQDEDVQELLPPQ